MKRLFRYLPALAADYSGAFSVLFEMDCLKVLHGQGGCTGNYCYADEFRWMDKKKNVFHTNMSEIEAVTGNDSIVINKTVQAWKDLGCSFIAVCGSPIPTVLGTDIQAIARIIEKKTHCPVLGLDTHGLGRYDLGQRMAYEALLDRFVPKGPAKEPGRENMAENGQRIVNVIGATPLDGWSQEMAEDFTEHLKKRGYQNVYIWGMGADIPEIAKGREASLNIAVSVSGLSTVRKMKEWFGIPYETGFPVGTEGKAGKERHFGEGKRACIVMEQFAGNMVRNCLREQFGFEEVNVVSFFTMERDYMEPGDGHVKYEEDLERLIAEGTPYDVVIGDAMISRFFGEEQPYIVISHPAVCAHNHTPDIREYSYEPHMAMVIGDYNTIPFTNLIGEKGYRFLKSSLKGLWKG